jgi:hypothetical protein
MAKESKTDAVIAKSYGATLTAGAFDDIYGGFVEYDAIGSIKYTKDDQWAIIPRDVLRAARVQINRLNKARVQQGLDDARPRFGRR